MLLEQIRASHADDQDRRVADPAEQVLDQVQEGRLGPLQVVEGDHERRVRREALEQPADRPHRLLRGARAAGDSDRARDPGRDLARVGLALDKPLDSLAGNLAGCPPDEVSERPVRDSLAVGEASSGEDGGLFVDARQQLLDEPRLADPRRPDDVDHAALARPDRLLERRAQAAQLLHRVRPSAHRAAWRRPARLRARRAGATRARAAPSLSAGAARAARRAPPRARGDTCCRRSGSHPGWRPLRAAVPSRRRSRSRTPAPRSDRPQRLRPC